MSLWVFFLFLVLLFSLKPTVILRSFELSFSCRSRAFISSLFSLLSLDQYKINPLLKRNQGQENPFSRKSCLLSLNVVLLWFCWGLSCFLWVWERERDWQTSWPLLFFSIFLWFPFMPHSTFTWTVRLSGSSSCNNNNAMNKWKDCWQNTRNQGTAWPLLPPISFQVHHYSSTQGW